MLKIEWALAPRAAPKPKGLESLAQVSTLRSAENRYFALKGPENAKATRLRGSEPILAELAAPSASGLMRVRNFPG